MKARGQRREKLEHQIRTCLGCRKKEKKNDLERFVAVDENTKQFTLVWDRGQDVSGQSLSGRGIYLHRSRECLQILSRNEVVARALKRTSQSLMIPKELYQELSSGLKDRDESSVMRPGRRSKMRL